MSTFDAQIGGVVCRSPLIAIAAYEREHSIPNNYINCSITRRGNGGAWQRFERGEIPLWDFYVAFGNELSDTVLGNAWYREYCAQRGIDCPKLPDKLEIDGRDVSPHLLSSHSFISDTRLSEARDLTMHVHAHTQLLAPDHLEFRHASALLPSRCFPWAALWPHDESFWGV